MTDKFRVSRLLTLTSLIAALAGAIVLAAAVHARAESISVAPQAVQQSATLYLPATLYAPPALSEAPIFGVQMYNDTRPGSQYHSSLLQSDATWLRVAVNWNLLEPNNVSPEEYRWNYADWALAAAAPAAGGLHIIGTIENAPQWAVVDPNKQDGPINAQNMADFVEFVAALVERFDGDGHQDAPGSPIVNYWEFYNEPDRRLNTTDGRWGLHPTEYAAMLAAVYPVVKNQSPNAQVVFGGLAYDFFEGPFVRSFLDDVLAAGGGAYFDVFNFHAYPGFAYNWLPPGVTDGGPGLLEKAQYLHAKLATYGLDKPFVVTEAGWHSNYDVNNPGSEEIQARYVAQLFVQSLAADIDAMIWWMLYNPGDGGWENGLITEDNPPRHKLAFTAYQTIVDRLTGREFVRVLPDAETGNTAMEAYEFTAATAGAALYVAWLDPMSTAATTTLALPGETAGMISLYGVPGATISDAADGADDGIVHVPVSAQPAYIEVMQ